MDTIIEAAEAQLRWEKSLLRGAQRAHEIGDKIPDNGPAKIAARIAAAERSVAACQAQLDRLIRHRDTVRSLSR